MINPAFVTMQLAEAIEAATRRLADPSSHEETTRAAYNDATKVLDRYLNNQAGHDHSEVTVIDLFRKVGRTRW